MVLPSRNDTINILAQQRKREAAALISTAKRATTNKVAYKSAAERAMHLINTAKAHQAAEGRLQRAQANSLFFVWLAS